MNICFSHHLDSSSLQKAAVAAVAVKLHYLLYKEKDPWYKNEESNWLQKIFCNSITNFAKFWHDYEIHGLDQLANSEGNHLLVGYHSRCTLDLFYFFCSLRCNVLASYLFYKVELTRPFLPLLGIIPSKSLEGGSTADSFCDALADSKKPLMLLPGGVFECLKASSMKNKVQWKDEPGFARVIKDNAGRLGSKTKVHAFYTRNCERILWSPDVWFDLTSSWCMAMYASFKGGNLVVMPPMLLLMLCSMGFLPLPLPCKVETFISEPMSIQPDESAQQFAARVRSRLQRLIDEVEARQEGDRRNWLHRLALLPYGAYVIVQNTILYSLASALIISMYPPVLVYSLYSSLFGGGRKSIQ